MGKKQEREIRVRLEKHAKLMAFFMRRGINRELSSKLAYAQIKSEVKAAMVSAWGKA